MADCSGEVINVNSNLTQIAGLPFVINYAQKGFDKMRITKKILLLILAVFLVALPNTYAIPVTGCQTIDSPGVYELQNDIINSHTSDCIHIRSSNVVFDGKGHVIDSDYDYYEGPGIYMRNYLSVISNITIKNVVVSEWYYEAIGIGNVDNITITNVNVISNGNDAIYLFNTNNSAITNNDIGESVEGDGIVLYSSTNVAISNNVISQNGRGISLVSSSGNTISNNNASLNGYGISLSSSSGNTLTSNTANSNTWRGINFELSNNNALIDNTITLNYAGIYFYSSNDNTLTNNSLLNNNIGIRLASSNNKIYNNYLKNTNNFYFETIYTNWWNTTRGPGMNILGGPYFAGNYWANPSGAGFSETCADVDNDGTCDTTYTLNSENTDYLPLSIPPPAAPSSVSKANIIAENPYIGPQLGVLGYKLKLQEASNGFNLSIWNFGEANASNSTLYVEIENSSNNYTVPYEFFIEPNSSIDLFINLSVSSGLHNISIFLTYNDTEMNSSFNRAINATLIAGELAEPLINMSLEINQSYYEVKSIVDGITYLINNQNPDGSWGENETRILTTAEVLATLIKADSNSTAIEAGLNFLDKKINESLNSSLNDTYLLSNMILPFINSNQTTLNVEEAKRRIFNSVNIDNGGGYSAEFRSDSLTMLLLGKIQGNDTWLMQNLKNDSWEVFEKDSAFVTGKIARSIPGENITENVINYLASQNNLSVIEESSRLSALTKKEKTPYVRNLASALEGKQSQNGSFGNFIETAYAVSALIDYYSIPLHLIEELYVEENPNTTIGGVPLTKNDIEKTWKNDNLSLEIPPRTIANFEFNNTVETPVNVTSLNVTLVYRADAQITGNSTIKVFDATNGNLLAQRNLNNSQITDGTLILTNIQGSPNFNFTDVSTLSVQIYNDDTKQPQSVWINLLKVSIGYTYVPPFPDTTPPVITNISNSSITSSSAVITWSTNENSNSVVKYGTVSGSYINTSSDAAYVTSHTIILTNLAPNTTYYYVVNSTDMSGNSAQSTEYSFKTAVAPAGPITLILRPNSDGTKTAWTGNYLAVDEEIQDGDSSYVYTTTKNAEESYNLQDHATQSGNISKVRVVVYGRQTGSEGTKLGIITGGTTYKSDVKTFTSSYAMYYYDWTINPRTSQAWAWADIDALQAYIQAVANGPWTTTEQRVTQVYVEVTYTP